MGPERALPLRENFRLMLSGIFWRGPGVKVAKGALGLEASVCPREARGSALKNCS